MYTPSSRSSKNLEHCHHGNIIATETQNIHKVNISRWHMYKPVEVDDIFMDTLEDLVESCQNLDVVLTELLVKVL